MRIDRWIKIGTVVLSAVVGCKGTEPIPQQPVSPDPIKPVMLSPWIDYRGSALRQMDLLHMDLEVSFDWERREVLGRARLFMTPHFYPQDYVQLDAKDFVINGVGWVNSDGEQQSLVYEYDQEYLMIYLGEAVPRGDTLALTIDYVARPYLNSKNDERGLYFINSDGQNPYLKRQIWTQGETDLNSRWFPTIDEPNERMTQKISITVSESFRTLSNGLLVSTQLHGDGLRTDTWVQDKPHAPYLVMISVNKHYVHSDSWNDIKVNYWVDSTGIETVEDVFGRTPEMIEFFSNQLGVPFPWDKYDQVVVSQFVSGAMENTTASVFMEDLQLTSNELVERDWDDIIAHELYHQWFGDLVTCESWSNLPLNESFATYGEYLWFEHAYGEERAAYAAWSSLVDYLTEASEETKEGIRFYYAHPDDMFDNHSYAKGGLILHMLRKYVGDAAFFASLQRYLTRHAFSSTEIHELRIAFEEVTGEDLNWFFEQWFLRAGHPVLNVTHTHESDTLYIYVSQGQELDTFPLFRLPLYLDLILKNEIRRYEILVEHEEHVFKLPISERPSGVILDGDYQLVGEINHSKTFEEWKSQYMRADGFRMRLDAVMQLSSAFGGATLRDEDLMQMWLADSSATILSYVLDWMAIDVTQGSREYEAAVRALCAHPDATVRASALNALAEMGAPYDFRNAMEDSSYVVRAIAFTHMRQRGQDVTPWITPFMESTNLNLLLPVAYYLNRRAAKDILSWYLDRLDAIRSGDQFLFLQPIKEYAITADPAEQKILQDRFYAIARNHYQDMTRFTAFQGLLLLEDTPEIRTMIEDIKASEKDELLLELYEDYEVN